MKFGIFLFLVLLGVEELSLQDVFQVVFVISFLVFVVKQKSTPSARNMEKRPFCEQTASKPQIVITLELAASKTRFTFFA